MLAIDDRVDSGSEYVGSGYEADRRLWIAAWRGWVQAAATLASPAAAAIATTPNAIRRFRKFHGMHYSRDVH